HDFSSFRDARCQAKTPVRSLEQLSVEAVKNDAWDEVLVRVAARSFLHHQVRIMVGTLVKVGLHHQPPEWVAKVLAARNRHQAGATAPSDGLYLVGVDYPA
ncbi:MAG: tRNA pseudouridine(38-40) synthase TruA, partial [Alphaproteobacteria bacterium]|nr:tRNA pseudouridine(38-40) synthase TruA [Alphaproteobacteria bacterium]